MLNNMKEIKFSKYHACGNDFIIIWEDDLNVNNINSLVVEICNRYTGIGADGFIITNKQLEMKFYNQDGSIASMCGNGIRALSLYLFNNNIINTDSFCIKTLAGTMNIEIVDKENKLFKCLMPSYDLMSEKLMITTSKKQFVKEKMMYQGVAFIVHAIYVGVKHLVIFVESFEKIDNEIGSFFCKHYLFKDDINVDFVIIDSPTQIRIKTYERGVGFTKACGTGAAASAIIGNLYYGLKNNIKVLFEFGEINILVKGKKVYMVGDAVKICDGVYTYYGG